MFSALTSPFPEVKVCVFYMRASCLLSQQRRKKLFFVVIRTFLLLEIDVFITRGVCFSSDDEDAEKKRNTCADKCANEPSLLFYFIGLGFFRPDCEIMQLSYAERMQKV